MRPEITLDYEDEYIFADCDVLASSFLIGQDLGEGQARVVVDGDVEGFPTGMLVLATATTVSPPRNLLEAGHALDVEMEQVTGSGMFVTHDGWSRMQIAPTTEPNPAQNAADRGRTYGGAARDLIARSMVTAQMNDMLDHHCGSRRGLR